MKRLLSPLLLGLALLAPAAADATDALTRPGGGHSYSGGSHSYSSGGSRSYSSGGSRSYSSGGSFSGGQVDFWAFIFLVCVFILVLGLSTNQTRGERKNSWDSGSGGPVFYPPPPRRSVGYAALTSVDPDFSAALFEDFVYNLYARVHAARSDPAALAALAAYVAPDTRKALLARDPSGVPIHGVIVGSMQLESLQVAAQVAVTLVIESNFTATLSTGDQGYYLKERWTLVRAASVRTPPPPAVYAFNCPSCGAAFQTTQDGRCAHCNQHTGDGRFDWTLTNVRRIDQELRPPALTSDVAEVGTDFPTVVHPELPAQWAALSAADPTVTTARLDQRLRTIYRALTDAWNADDLARVRPFVSDSLHNYLAYWLAAYRAQGLRNVLADADITAIELVKVVRDRHLDALTLRFWAEGLDYTLAAATRQRVSGSDIYPRRYSEYWTLIRGSAARGAPQDDRKCPNCGAESRVNMAGNCEYCGAHLTRGEFDWVLSKIEQDESYTG